MTTPLFPKNDAFVTIRQGKTGDCYLLAALDCILNSGPEGYAAIKSLFKEREDGVEVRIKSTDLTQYLQKEKLHGKYNYHYDPMTNQDVFFIDKKKLQEIDQTTYGVKSNSLAIKILERLSSYYLVSDWDQKLPLASIVAHKTSKRHKETSTKFMGQLLGFMAHDTRDVHEIVRLKTIAPQSPIYISMSYGQVDAHGERHGRHALRIDKIIPNANSAGGYDFVLVNPWDNQKRETYSLDEILERKCRFSVFSTKPYKNDLKFYEQDLREKLFKVYQKIGKKIFADDKLYQMVLKMSEVNGNALDLRTINKCVKLYERISGLPNLFEALSPSDQKAMISCVAINSKPTKFINSFLSAVPTARSVVSQQVDLTKYYVTLISEYPIASVNFDDSIESVKKYKEAVISKLQKIKNRAFSQKKHSQLDNATIEKAFGEKLREVDALFQFGLYFKQLNTDLNQELNIDLNQDLNIDLNQELNIAPNQGLNIDLNQELNIDPNQSLNIDLNQELRIDPNQRIDLNQSIDINRYRFGLFFKPASINPSQNEHIDLNQELDIENKP
ncbi:hypothetical protein [Legionella sainthelensi]|uniref:hypothetical protein n=1 Tax=Legionella sainthelensi TaxID=28087 RepID=UPI000E201C85|nr:hypothetical protein [Legionella sainthelensi]